MKCSAENWFFWSRFGVLRSQGFQKYKYHFCCQNFVWAYKGGHCGLAKSFTLRGCRSFSTFIHVPVSREKENSTIRIFQIESKNFALSGKRRAFTANIYIFNDRTLLSISLIKHISLNSWMENILVALQFALFNSVKCIGRRLKYWVKFIASMQDFLGKSLLKKTLESK